MSSLTEFLLARIDEDEAVARDGVERQAQFWIDIPVGWFSPTRVLAECAAKRRIIALWTDLHKPDPYDGGDVHDPANPRTDGCEPHDGIDWALSDVFRALAAPYSSHPDFDSAWGSDV